jgi:hypothetical protein
MLTHLRLEALVTKNQGYCKHEITQIKRLHTFCLSLNISLENYSHTQINHKLNNTHLFPFLHLY